MLKEAGINVPEMDANAMRKSFSAVEPNGVGSTMQILSYAKLIYDVHDLYMFLAFGINAALQCVLVVKVAR